MQLSQTTQYATYERTITVKTYTYTATVVTEAGESTATLTARQDPEWGSRRREIACPGTCSCWYTMYWNINLQQYEPVHCNNCCIGLYDIHIEVEQPAPAIVTPEPAATPVAASQEVSIETSENATEAEPGPVVEPAALKPVDPNKKQYFVTWAPSMTSDKTRYGLLCRRMDGYAIDCSCNARVKRGRKSGKCCKHMTAHNAMITPATRKQEAA